MIQALLDTLENTETIDADSILTPAIELKNNLIAIRNVTNNWGFILFLLCFLIIVSIISNRNKFLPAMFSGLFRNKDRHSMFYETVTNETLNKLFLSIEMVLLLSIILYCYAVHEHFILITSLTQLFFCIGKTCLLVIAFFLYKFLTYSIIGAVFFKKETAIQWNEDFFSLISLNGIFLFLPTFILFYIEPVYAFCLYFMIIYLIFNLCFVFYKIYTLFFAGKQRLLYFILYLCTQEIIPIYLMYRGFIYLIAQKDTIWIQI